MLSYHIALDSHSEIESTSYHSSPFFLDCYLCVGKKCSLIIDKKFVVLLLPREMKIPPYDIIF